MRRYIELWTQFLKMSWMSDMEYRLNFVLRVVGDVVWYAAQLSVFEVLFLHTTTLNGWDLNSMRLFMATLFLVDCIYMILFQENMDNISNLVKRGDLDFYLVKPVSSQFMVTFRKIGTAFILNLAIVVAYLIWTINNLNHSVTPLQLGIYALLVILGVIIYYSVRFLFGMLVVVLQDAGNIHFVWYQIFRLGSRPDILYPPVLRFVILTVLPVAFMASVPARVLVEGVSLELLGAALVLAILTAWFSAVMWKQALKHYSSASS